MVPLMVAREGLPALFSGGGLWGLLITDPWEPLSSRRVSALRHAWLSTIIVTLIALALAAPVGFGIGVFIAEIAPATMRRLLQPALELLAGIPSVVYGFFGYVTLVPWFEQYFDMPTGESLLVAGLDLRRDDFTFHCYDFGRGVSRRARGREGGSAGAGNQSLVATCRVLIRHAAPAECSRRWRSGWRALWVKRWRY